MQEKLYKKALNSAAGMLSRRALTEKQIREKLAKKEYTDDIIESVIGRLYYLDLIDDSKYAESALRSLKIRGYGKLRIRYELIRKGVPKNIAEEALCDFEADNDILFKLIDKRLKGECFDIKEIQKTSASLARKGYTWEEINTAIKNYKRYMEDYG